MNIIIAKSARNQSNLDLDVQNRTILAVGKDAVNRVSKMKFGVIGLGGLGIITIELLARLGIKVFVIIDNDSVSSSNLNRHLSATKLDVRLDTLKTTIATRLLYDIDPGIDIETINGDFLENECQEGFISCDIIFGCSDSVGVRLAANHLCLSKGIVYYDLGCGVKVTDGKMASAGGQILQVIPGRGYCVNCCGLFDLNKAAVDFADPEESERQRAMGYIEGASIPEPSVYALNMMIASEAVWMMMRLVSGERLDFDGVYIDAINFQTYPWSEKEKREKEGDNHCVVCGKNGFEFGGDSVELIARDHDSNNDIPGNDSSGESKLLIDNNIKDARIDNAALSQGDKNGHAQMDFKPYQRLGAQCGVDIRIMLEDAIPRVV